MTGAAVPRPSDPPVAPAVDPAAQAAATWAEVLAHATLGTRRRPDVPVLVVAGRVVAGRAVAGQVVAGTADRAPVVSGDGAAETRLLSAAAALWAGGRASARAVHVGTADPRWTAPAESWPVAPGDAADLLELLLAGVVRRPVQQRLLVRWLVAAGSAGWRVPARLLADVLGAAPAPLPAAAVPALGARGPWLAAVGPPRWAGAVQDADAAAHRLGGSPAAGPARLAAARLFADAPQRGRAVVAARWGAWPPGVRAAVCAGAAAHVAGADEAWLEPALDDPAAAVRHAAAAALGRLPGSRRAARMTRRLADLLTITARPLGPPRAVVDDRVLPDAAGLRDATGDPPGAGRAAWWQAQVLAAVPSEGWAKVAGGVAAATRVQSTDPALLLGAATAAGLTGDAAWARRLLPALLRGHDPGAGGPVGQGPRPASPVPQLGWARWAGSLAVALGAIPGPWPADVSGPVLTWALGHPRPSTALDVLGDLLAERAGADLDARLADLPLGGPDAEATGRALRAIRTTRSLQRAVDALRPTDLTDHQGDPHP